MSNKKILQGHNKALESLATIAGIPIKEKITPEMFGCTKMAIDDVPEAHREEVKAKLPNNDYGIDDTTYNNVIDDYTMELVEKGVL